MLITHNHGDHASGVPALRAEWPRVVVRRWVPDGSAGDRGLTDGEWLTAGARRLQVLHTPGHAPDHVCFWDDQAGDLYAGDMVVQGSTVMIPAGRGGNLRQYLASLERLAALRPARILPGHGPVIDDPLALIAQYISHRRQREEQVLACLAEGVSDPDAIVARIYVGLADAVRPAARQTVMAHLEKLREEGRLT